MANILFTWELGGGMGHTTRSLPVLRGLVARGHRVWAVLRDESRAKALFGGMGISSLPAPMDTPRPAPIA